MTFAATTEVGIEALGGEGRRARRQAGQQGVACLCGQEGIVDAEGRVERARRKGRLAFLNGFGADELAFEERMKRLADFVMGEHAARITAVAGLQQSGFPQGRPQPALAVSRPERPEVRRDGVPDQRPIGGEDEHIAELRRSGGIEQTAAIERDACSIGGRGKRARRGECATRRQADVPDPRRERRVDAAITARRFGSRKGRILRQLKLTAPRKGPGESIAFAQIQRILIGKLDVRHDVAATIAEIPTGSGADKLLGVVALVRQAHLATNLHAIKIALEDKVDDAGDSVRAVNCRIAARDDIDPIDEIDGNGVDVDRLLTWRRSHVTAAVLQNERAGRALAAQIERADPGGADEAAGVLRRERRAELRQQAQPVADRHGAGIGQLDC